MIKNTHHNRTTTNQLQPAYLNKIKKQTVGSVRALKVLCTWWLPWSTQKIRSPQQTNSQSQIFHKAWHKIKDFC